MPKVEFHKRSEPPEMAEVPVCGRVIVMSVDGWLDFARDIVQQIEAHLTQRAPDLAAPCENHILYVACGYKYCPNCGKPLGG